MDASQITSFVAGGDFVSLTSQVFNWFLKLAVSIMGYDFNFGTSSGDISIPGLPQSVVDQMLEQNPELQAALVANHSVTFSDLYDWFLGIGLVLVNLFCLISICRQASRLRDQMTLEMVIEMLIRIAVCNAILLFGQELMRTLIDISGIAASFLVDVDSTAAWEATDVSMDVGSVVSALTLGIFAIIEALICGIIICVTVLQRIVHIYILYATMPIAMSTIVGDQEVRRTSSSWIRAFLGAVFEIVIIALVFFLAGRIVQPLLHAWAIGDSDGWFDGFLVTVSNMAYMMFFAVSVKGAPALFRRAFGLQ